MSAPPSSPGSSGGPATPPLLALDGIDTFYGPVQVHFGLTLEVRTGQIVCLLGGNASGKSTTMKVILGLLRPRAGRVLLDGADITGMPTPSVIRRGVGSVPEARRLFPAMTVRENLLMGAFARRDHAAVAEDLERMLALFPRVRERLHARAGTLSGGEQQMVAMARALMGRPRLLCMDEPTMGLSPLYVDRVLELVGSVAASGGDGVHGRAKRQPGTADRALRVCAADGADYFAGTGGGVGAGSEDSGCVFGWGEGGGMSCWSVGVFLDSLTSCSR